MKRIPLISTSALFLFFVVSSTWYSSKLNLHNNTVKAETGDSKIIDRNLLDKLSTKAELALECIKSKRYNDQICFLIDMSIESGQNRFFIYDLENDSIVNGGLVTHGRCNEWWLNGRKYGNNPGCGCSSLGKYKIGSAYHGRFGLAYKLHGLDSSNSNAYKRYVVLHAHECVPEAEVHPDPICQSDGCPTVSPGFIKQLSRIIDNSSKPVLMWIYE